MVETTESIWYLNPILYIAIAGVVIGSLSFVLNFWAKIHDKTRSFRDDYRKELESLLSIFNNMMSKESLYSNAIWIVFRHDKLTGKRVLQHLYTCEKTRELYEIVKNYYKTNTETPNQAEIFCSKFKPIWLDLKKSVNPDFGACEDCVKHIKLKHVQKHKKTLKKCDDSMWDFIFE